MILFEQDWLKPEHVNAIVHYETRNKSALEFSAKLRHMGIRNHAFFLSLLNPRLRHIDPFSEELTIEEMSWVAIECRNNPWYYFREVCRVPARAGLVTSYVEFNRSNICLWWSFFNHITLFLTQPRQTGKSFCVDLLMTLLMNFVCNNTQINLMTKDDKLRGENIQRLKDIYDTLPTYLQLKTKDDVNNTEELSIRALGNSYKTFVPQASEKRAYNLGRGMTTPIFQSDEGPFQVNFEIALGSAMGAMGAAIEAARANNEPYGIIHTTTAGRKDDPDGQYMYGMIQDCAIWTEAFYDMKNEEELRKVVCMHSRSSRHKAMPQNDDKFDGNYEVYAVFSYKQLGKDDDWMMEQLTRTKQKGQDADRDFFNIWTAGTNTSPLDPDLAERVAAGIVDCDHAYPDPEHGYMLYWYVDRHQVESFMKSRDIVVGIDTSDAVGRDHIGMIFTDVLTGGVVARTFIDRTNLIQYAKWLVKLLVTWPRLTMIIERRSSGVAILDYLLEMLPQHGIDPFKRLFNWVINDPVQYKNLYEEATQSFARQTAETYIRAKERFGFATAGTGQAARSELYNGILFEAASDCTNRIHDRMLIQQILGLVTRNGRIDHATNEHDDLVVAWMLTQWFLRKAKNLQHYGIDSKRVLQINAQSVRQAQTADKPMAQLHEQMQQLLRQRIQHLVEKLQGEDDPLLIQRYENELKHLEGQLVLKDGESFSLDAVLNDMRDQRSNRHRQAREYYQYQKVQHQANAYYIDRNQLPENTRLVA